MDVIRGGVMLPLMLVVMLINKQIELCRYIVWRQGLRIVALSQLTALSTRMAG